MFIVNEQHSPKNEKTIFEKAFNFWLYNSFCRKAALGPCPEIQAVTSPSQICEEAERPKVNWQRLLPRQQVAGPFLSGHQTQVWIIYMTGYSRAKHLLSLRTNLSYEKKSSILLYICLWKKEKYFKNNCHKCINSKELGSISLMWNTILKHHTL